MEFSEYERLLNRIYQMYFSSLVIDEDDSVAMRPK